MAGIFDIELHDPDSPGRDESDDSIDIDPVSFYLQYLSINQLYFCIFDLFCLSLTCGFL